MLCKLSSRSWFKTDNNKRLRRASLRAANRMHGQRTGDFTRRPGLRPFQENQSIQARPYPELRTWMVVRPGVITVFTTPSRNSPTSPDMRPAPWLHPACLPTTTSIPAPIQPTTAMTNYTHAPTVTNLSAFHALLRSSASVGHPQAPVAMQQQQQQQQRQQQTLILLSQR